MIEFQHHLVLVVVERITGIWEEHDSRIKCGIGLEMLWKKQKYETMFY